MWFLFSVFSLLLLSVVLGLPTLAVGLFILLRRRFSALLSAPMAVGVVGGVVGFVWLIGTFVGEDGLRAVLGEGLVDGIGGFILLVLMWAGLAGMAGGVWAGVWIISKLRNVYRNVLIALIVLGMAVFTAGGIRSETLDSGLDAFTGAERTAAERAYISAFICKAPIDPVKFRVVPDGDGGHRVQAYTWMGIPGDHECAD